MDSDFNWTITFSDSHWCAEVVGPQWRCYGVSSGYQTPPACLLGGVCSEGAAGRLPASLTGVFCGVVDCIVEFYHLLFGVCVALLRALWWMSRRGFPFASWGHGLCTLWRLWHSVTLVAWCVAPWGTIGCCIWLYGSWCMDIYFSLWPVCFLILWLSMMFVTVLFFVFVAFCFDL